MLPPQRRCVLFLGTRNEWLVGHEPPRTRHYLQLINTLVIEGRSRPCSACVEWWTSTQAGYPLPIVLGSLPLRVFEDQEVLVGEEF